MSVQFTDIDGNCPSFESVITELMSGFENGILELLCAKSVQDREFAKHLADALDVRVTDHDDRVTAIETALGNLTSDPTFSDRITSLQELLNTLDVDSNGNFSEITGLIDRMTAAEALVAQLNASVTSQGASLTSVTAQITTIAQTVATHTQQITAIIADISGLTDRVAALESAPPAFSPQDAYDLACSMMVGARNAAQAWLADFEGRVAAGLSCAYPEGLAIPAPAGDGELPPA